MKDMFEKALTLHQSGRLREAETLYRKILKKHPDHPDTLHLLGCIHIARGRPNQAVSLIKKAVSLLPTAALYHESLANACQKSGDLESAESEALLALRLDKTLVEPLNTLGLVYRDKGDYEHALNCFYEAIEKKTPNIDAMINLSTVLHRMGQNDFAEKYLRVVLNFDPKNALAWNNIGLALRGQRRLAEAKEAFTKASKYPPAAFNLGFVHLLEDDLKNGLPLYEKRKKLLNIGKGMTKPEWDGGPGGAKTLLVLAEQGLGDTIMMSRFYQVLVPLFKRVIVHVQPPLERLIRTISPDFDIVTDIKSVACDCWCTSMSIPFLLGIDTVEKIPVEPWITLPGMPGNTTDTGSLRIGLNWAGNPSFMYDSIRSTHIENLKLLLEAPNVEWYSLHKGQCENEADAFNLRQPLKDAKDFYDTAVFMKTLDMVVSTETVVPNLAAAMGIPTYVMTSVDRSWRWKSWYRNVTVCSQDTPGNWYEPVVKVLKVIKTTFEARGIAV